MNGSTTHSTSFCSSATADASMRLVVRDWHALLPRPDADAARDWLGRLWTVCAATDDLLSAFDVDAIEPEALLFQTGYLTIQERSRTSDGEPLYRLGYPNREVRQSLNRVLLRAMAPDPSRQLATSVRLRELLAVNDFAGIETLFRSFFASIPYQWHTRNEIARYEGYYASVFYSHFAAAGLDVVVEDSSNLGRVDMAVRFNSHIYLFEFKVVELRCQRARRWRS